MWDITMPKKAITNGIRARHRTMYQLSRCFLLGPEGGRGIWWQSHIDWRKERVPARTLGPEGRWIPSTGFLPKPYFTFSHALPLITSNCHSAPPSLPDVVSAAAIVSAFRRNLRRSSLSQSHARAIN
ncbi:hypothetical protein SDJN02_14916, partial [Cucurbita argyrosperma subsp. argyrosperma]